MKILTNTGALLAGEVIPTLARAVVITRVDGTKIGFSAGTAPTYDGVTFSENILIETGSITMTANDNPSRVDITVAMRAAGPITLADVQDGLYEGASVELLLYNTAAPGGADLVYWGDVGAVRYTNLGVFEVQINGPLSRLRNFVTETYGPTCRAFLGDSRCGISLASITETGTISSVSADGRTLTVSGITSTAGYWNLGLFTMTSGDMKGMRREVRDSGGGSVEFYAPLGRLPEAGDTFSIRRGCSYDTSETTGCRHYDNILNYRGEPWLDDDAARSIITSGNDPYSAFTIFLAGFNGAIVDEAQGATLGATGASASGSPKFGSQSLSLNGSSYVRAPDVFWVFAEGQFTVEAWVNFSDTGSDQCIISGWSSILPSARGLRFGYYPTALGGFGIQWQNTLAGTFHSCVGAWSPSPGTWYHVAVDRDVSGTMRVYVDGAVIASLSAAGHYIGMGGNVVIGGQHTTSSLEPDALFEGAIDELRVTKGMARYGSSSGYTVPTAAFPRPL